MERRSSRVKFGSGMVLYSRGNVVVRHQQAPTPWMDGRSDTDDG
ncbi:ACR8 [Zea mays]|uniref:ACR8 n=1 Tax=Zea mays TaxID=4577 RepID=A0A1D6PWW6_MAIZE|nr:ACR8 [Zea mays]